MAKKLVQGNWEFQGLTSLLGGVSNWSGCWKQRDSSEYNFFLWVRLG